MKLLDPNDPFFRRPLVRWLTVLVPLAWAGFELWSGNTLWAILFGAAGAWAAWVFMSSSAGK